MSISILLLSVVFALIEAGLTWLLLAFEPVAVLTAALPTWLLVGSVFALGMMLSFIVIIMVGLLEISPRAARFVRDHFGRTVLLGFLSVILVFVLALGGEALYQVGPYQGPVRKPGKVDLCFLLDYSASMAGKAENNMKAAFEQVVNGVDDVDRISVVGYGEGAATLQPWIELDANSKGNIITAVKNKAANAGSTDMKAALKTANGLIEQAAGEGRTCAVVMICDGGGNVNSTAGIAPKLSETKTPIFAMYISNGGTAAPDNLNRITRETGGQLVTTTSDLTEICGNMTQIVEQAIEQQSKVKPNDYIPDTLLTERDKGRMSLISPAVLRVIVLFIVCFVFKLISVICVGNNNRFMGHFLHALFIALLAALAVEFGYVAGLPVMLVASVFWILMMNQIILTY